MEEWLFINKIYAVVLYCGVKKDNVHTPWVITRWIMSNIFRDWLNTRHLWPSDLRLFNRETRKTIFPDSCVSTLSEGPKPFGWVANDGPSWSAAESSSTSLNKKKKKKKGNTQKTLAKQKETKISSLSYVSRCTVNQLTLKKLTECFSLRCKSNDQAEFGALTWTLMVLRHLLIFTRLGLED